MADTTILQKVIAEVERILQSELAKGFVYHDLAHTRSVVNYCEEFAKHYQVADGDQEILAIAAWFHDIGYSKVYIGHEDESELIARTLSANTSLPFRKDRTHCSMHTGHKSRYPSQQYTRRNYQRC